MKLNFLKKVRLRGLVFAPAVVLIIVTIGVMMLGYYIYEKLKG